MADFFIIQSREPFSDMQAKSDFELIHNLASSGNNVTVLLIQNGVLPARRNSLSKEFDKLCYSDVNIMVDSFSLNQREIKSTELKMGVRISDVKEAVSAMLLGHRVIWH